ncbi:MAG: asparagine--tRNA ligase [Candidatus Bilamarchaeaceae archaeon]
MFKHISDVLKESEGKKVSIRGWVYRERTSGSIRFLIIRDGSGIIQCAVKKEKVDEESWKAASEAYIESSIEITGTTKKDQRAPGGTELQVESVTLVNKGEPFPISKDLSEEFLLDVRHLWLRSQKLTNIMKARYHIVNHLREFFDKEGFFELAPPIITKSQCEGGATLFEMNYFGEKAYLTQSSQLYAEVFIFGLEKVYVLAPSFRAEKSRTVRHLAEYWHLEPEMAWYDQKMNMELQENMIEYVVQKMVKNHPELLEACGRDPDELKKVKAPFPRLDYEDAVAKVNELGGKMEYGQDFGADEEALLTKEYDVPVFVHHFPKGIKAFYMREDPEKPGTVLNDDLLAPRGHGEIIGGSERIWELDELITRMKEFGLDPNGEMKWYVDLRRYGSVPHSGFGLGIERLTKWILNLDHIRDAIPFPRTITRCYP